MRRRSLRQRVALLETAVTSVDTAAEDDRELRREEWASMTLAIEMSRQIKSKFEGAEWQPLNSEYYELACRIDEDVRKRGGYRAFEDTRPPTAAEVKLHGPRIVRRLLLKADEARARKGPYISPPPE